MTRLVVFVHAIALVCGTYLPIVLEDDSYYELNSPPPPSASLLAPVPVPEPTVEPLLSFSRTGAVQTTKQIEECLCPDVAPSYEFPCEYEVVVGNCDFPANARLMLNQQFVYCLCSCDLCTDPDSLPQLIVPQSQILQVINGSGENAFAFGMSQGGGV